MDNYENPVQNLTEDQVAQHYSACIKLSVENKINQTNAFDLHLINILHNKIYNEDFKFSNKIGSSLHAGGKIYANRVDFVHQNVLKASSELTSSKTKQQQQQQEGGEPGDPANLQEADGAHNKLLGKRTRAGGPTSAATPGAMIMRAPHLLSRIRVKEAAHFTECDPLFRYQSQQYDQTAPDEATATTSTSGGAAITTGSNNNNMNKNNSAMKNTGGDQLACVKPRSDACDLLLDNDCVVLRLTDSATVDSVDDVDDNNNKNNNDTTSEVPFTAASSAPVLFPAPQLDQLHHAFSQCFSSIRMATSSHALLAKLCSSSSLKSFRFQDDASDAAHRLLEEISRVSRRDPGDSMTDDAAHGGDAIDGFATPPRHAGGDIDDDDDDYVLMGMNQSPVRFLDEAMAAEKGMGGGGGLDDVKDNNNDDVMSMMEEFDENEASKLSRKSGMDGMLNDTNLFLRRLRENMDVSSYEGRTASAAGHDVTAAARELGVWAGPLLWKTKSKSISMETWAKMTQSAAAAADTQSQEGTAAAAKGATGMSRDALPPSSKKKTGSASLRLFGYAKDKNTDQLERVMAAAATTKDDATHQKCVRKRRALALLATPPPKNAHSATNSCATEWCRVINVPPPAVLKRIRQQQKGGAATTTTKTQSRGGSGNEEKHEEEREEETADDACNASTVTSLTDTTVRRNLQRDFTLPTNVLCDAVLPRYNRLLGKSTGLLAGAPSSSSCCNGKRAGGGEREGANDVGAGDVDVDDDDDHNNNDFNDDAADDHNYGGGGEGGDAESDFFTQFNTQTQHATHQLDQQEQQREEEEEGAPDGDQSVIQFAKKAKRINVARLKSRMWMRIWSAVKRRPGQQLEKEAEAAGGGAAHQHLEQHGQQEGEKQIEVTGTARDLELLLERDEQRDASVEAPPLTIDFGALLHELIPANHRLDEEGSVETATLNANAKRNDNANGETTNNVNQISVQIVFNCLLHLANEKTLFIESCPVTPANQNAAMMVAIGGGAEPPERQETQRAGGELVSPRPHIVHFPNLRILHGVLLSYVRKLAVFRGGGGPIQHKRNAFEQMLSSRGVASDAISSTNSNRKKRKSNSTMRQGSGKRFVEEGGVLVGQMDRFVSVSNTNNSNGDGGDDDSHSIDTSTVNSELLL